MAESTARVYRAFILLCMGCTAIAALVIAADPLRRYSELSKGTLAYYGIFLAGGVALALCLFMALRFPVRLHKVAVGGVAAILALAINQFVALRLGTILCFTPS